MVYNVLVSGGSRGLWSRISRVTSKVMVIEPEEGGHCRDGPDEGSGDDEKPEET